MRVLWLLILRDIRIAFGRGGVMMPVIFFLIVGTLYPFGVGPDAALLAQTGGGVLWIAALLASLLPIDRLIAPDADAGVLDQIALRGVSDELISSPSSSRISVSLLSPSNPDAGTAAIISGGPKLTQCDTIFAIPTSSSLTPRSAI